MPSSSHSVSSVMPTGKTELRRTSTSSCTPFLHANINEPHSCTRGRAGIRESMLALETTCSKGGTLMVGSQYRSLEWQKSGSGKSRSLDRIRCLLDRLGSVLPRFPHEWAVVSQGEESPHKQSRTPCSLSSGEILPKIPYRLARSPKDEQLNSGSVCKKHGRDCLRPGNIISEGPLDVVLKQKHTPVCTVPPGEGEYHSRRGVESDEGLLRLALEEECVQADRASLPRDEC